MIKFAGYSNFVLSPLGIRFKEVNVHFFDWLGPQKIEFITKLEASKVTIVMLSSWSLFTLISITFCISFHSREPTHYLTVFGSYERCCTVNKTSWATVSYYYYYLLPQEYKWEHETNLWLALLYRLFWLKMCPNVRYVLHLTSTRHLWLYWIVSFF